jgi:hypothetical protein
MKEQDTKLALDLSDKIFEASHFGWDSFLRLMILILILTAIGVLFLYIYIQWKRKFLHQTRTADPSISSLASGIPDILKIVEKMAEYQQETVYRIMGYISQERLGYISRRYVRGFVSFCQINNSIDDIQKEFDDMLEDIAREAVDHKTFKNYMKECGLILDIIQDVESQTFSPYQLQKKIEHQVLQGVAEAIKESKKISFVEVN